PPLSTLFPYTTLFRSDIAHRDAASRLAGMFLNDGVFRIAAFLLQNPFQPAGSSRGVRRGGTQAIKKMGRESAVAGGIGILRQNRDRKSTRLNSSHVKS